ncbi:hypothetical protein AAFF27_15245 [Xylophilus sp. GW821-FHT01B05]
MAGYLLRLARGISPLSVARAQRGPKKDKPGGYVTAAVARKRLATARVLRKTLLKHLERDGFERACDEIMPVHQRERRRRNHANAQTGCNQATDDW